MKLEQPRTVDDGRVVLTEILDMGNSNALYRGHLDVDPQQRRIVTQTANQTVATTKLRQTLALDFDGIAALEFIGPVDQPDGITWVGHCLVEVEPRGTRVTESLPIGEHSGMLLALQLVELVERVHAAGQLVLGIRPESVYVGSERGRHDRLLDLVPRASRFLDTAQSADHGVPILAEIYRAPEDLLRQTPEPRSDVFAICATVFQLIAHRHPLGQHLPQQMQNLTGEARTAFPGDRTLGNLLAAGMRPNPTDRLDLAALGAGLASLLD